MAGMRRGDFLKLWSGRGRDGADASGARACASRADIMTMGQATLYHAKREVAPFKRLLSPNKGYELRLIQDFLGHRDPKHNVDHIIGPLARRLPGCFGGQFSSVSFRTKKPRGGAGLRDRNKITQSNAPGLNKFPDVVVRRGVIPRGHRQVLDDPASPLPDGKEVYREAEGSVSPLFEQTCRRLRGHCGLAGEPAQIGDHLIRCRYSDLCRRLGQL